MGLLDGRRRARARAELEAQLAPAHQVTIGEPDGPVATVCVAAVTGDRAPAVALLGLTREHRAHDLRSSLVDHLVRVSLTSPRWLVDWAAEAPTDPDLALLRGAFLVEQAWEVRSHQRARQVAEDQWRGFFALLEDATPWLERAAASGSSDPVVWQWRLRHARAREAETDELLALEEQLLAVGPDHFPGLRQALSWRLPRWHRQTMRECFAFASERAGAAPGTAAELVALLCAVEALVEGVDAEHREESDHARRRAEAWLAGPGAAHPQAPVGHSMLVRYCWARRLDRDAFTHLRALGTAVPAYPWDLTRDPSAILTRVRTEVLDALTATR